MAALGSLLLAIACVYLGLTAYLYLTQKHMLYLPDLPGRQIDATPEQRGLDYETVRLTTEDGVRLHGWFLPAADEQAPVLLFFHGNAGNISHRIDSLMLFHGLGLSVFIIDYRGYGQSEGSVSESGTYQDATAAWQYLVKQRGIPPSRIVVFGRSLGGPIAAWLASRHRPAALIVESAFISVPEAAAEHYPFFPVRWLSRLRYPTRDYLRQATTPVLVVHSRDDETIPVRHGRELHAAAPEPKSFLELSGGHNDAPRTSHDAYRRGLRRFLEEQQVL